VTATDASEQMLEVARGKAAGNPLVRVEKLDLTALTPPPHRLPEFRERESKQSQNLRSITASQGKSGSSSGLKSTVPSEIPNPEFGGEFGKILFSGVFANFGVLNCLSDLRPIATWLAERVQPGGIAAFGVMSPLCLWELAWHGLHGDLRTATRRLRKTTTFTPDRASEAIPIAYPSIRHLTRHFAPHFKRVHVEGIGLFLPPSDVYGVLEKRPRLLKTLTRLERRFAPLPLLASFADHYWIELVRVPSD
jgi:hypothetical protein